MEMILLSASGWSPPRIAEYLGVHAATVRRVLKAWSHEGLDALEHKLPGPVPDVERHAMVVGMLEKFLSEPRTWTSSQLAEALAGVGIQMSARQTERYLAELGAGWRRTKSSLEHLQQPEAVERARRKLTTLKKSPRPEARPLLPR
ncbi:helix-turn-helix domain-containing protein [Archangium lansingense]|uniref:Helix-turn-helix domain-containing protein n=1 Tax=Archangium lansingense TaxID=2995310 RepID=A0ABT4A518_9BACT|nr:helix-turn-helix domain-containing protein [Archangium lansinium]MCY1074051.1 helix-turn-helix domain-containing protein [Archangium lansinium]MCY1076743.1 helix-turn-helix domain-containing protein [Archangium lansinium]MCY1082770.1 helix-turn-helix domain-containing protein [Archangium lansinium]